MSLSINIHAMGMPFDGDTVATKSLGGSESAAYYLARGLAARGHKVNCWTNIDHDSTKDGVAWLACGKASPEAPLGERFEHYARNTPHDVLIVQRGAIAFHKPYASKVNIWQLHDLALYRFSSSMMGGMWQIDAVTTVSDWHKRQLLDVWTINPDTIHVVRNGVDAALYAGDRVELPAPLPQNCFKLLYQSRPERGLEHLVRPGGIMDRCRDLNVKLIVTTYDNTVEQMRGYYAQLEAWGHALPNVVQFPALSKPQLATLQRSCDLLLYPTEFQEVSCITAMEAMHASLPMLTSDQAALAETCKDSGTILIPLKDDKADEDAFVAELHDLFGQEELLSDNTRLTLEELAQAQATAARLRSWEDPVTALETLCHKLMADKVSVPRALKHAVEHSDIDFARWVLRTQDATDPISKSVAREINRMYAFTTSDTAYAAHYAKHQGVYYDANEQAVIGEDVTGTTRFRGVLNAMAEIRNRQSRGSRVLDYGCAHGHYLVPLAKLFSDSEFTGVDISDRAVLAARKWVEIEKLPNANIHALKDVTWRQQKYDIIIAAEVLEHVRDASVLLEELRGLLTEDGAIIFTTPNGRWEWTGTVPFRSGREHLRHYERKDIEDLCGKNDKTVLHAPAGVDAGGRPNGSWVWAVWPREPFGEIDYARKFAEYAPRETVTACMIVKDGEKTLRKCVESFVDFVDEVRIYIDPATTDRTAQVCEQLIEDFPNREIVHVMARKSAMKDGFDEARNESIAQAAGDWILWIDADEELRHADRMHLFLRPSMHNGFGFPQVHYSADPDQVLTTDFPCRLFRNNQGAKFYGVVHEHPETVLGKAITWSLVRHEMKFLHGGYVDEETRRKRYERNFPLLMRDREKYPTRQLNSFLMLRDIAQGLMFEHQQTGGRRLHGQIERAQEGIKLFERLVDGAEQIRMIGDCMQYYSHCVVTTGGGFDAEVTIRSLNEVAPDLAASFNFKGRFHSRDFYNKVANKFLQESTKLYESRYL
jgi:2-polyprenyl-3-methyl-5-hydroxy-6-metoxy-1,4-benzoquinol methylase/glycosyltransferase involved in cell wall biosynthesis